MLRARRTKKRILCRLCTHDCFSYVLDQLTVGNLTSRLSFLDFSKYAEPCICWRLFSKGISDIGSKIFGIEILFLKIPLDYIARLLYGHVEFWIDRSTSRTRFVDKSSGTRQKKKRNRILGRTKCNVRNNNLTPLAYFGSKRCDVRPW